MLISENMQDDVLAKVFIFFCFYIMYIVSLYCTVYLVMPVSADGLGIVLGCLTIKLIQLVGLVNGRCVGPVGGTVGRGLPEHRRPPQTTTDQCEITTDGRFAHPLCMYHSFITCEFILYPSINTVCGHLQHVRRLLSGM